MSNADELNKWKKLFDEGAISEEEFNKQKEIILSGQSSKPINNNILYFVIGSIVLISLFIFFQNDDTQRVTVETTEITEAPEEPLEELSANSSLVVDSIEEISTCAISGAVGTFANIDPSVEKHVAKKLKLNVEPISTQIIPRDRHAQFFSTLGIIAGSIERLATEIRHLQRTEVLEVEEFFGKKQKGSSAMPHKRNPILSENLTGLARLVRSTVIPALENIALWHERDISHSAVERNIGPDATITLDFALNRLSNVVKNLNVYPKNMRKNLDITNGIFFSQRVLLELTAAGFSREESYKIVQKNAMQAWKENASFFNKIINDKKITNKIAVNKLKKLFNFSYHTKKINIIFNRSLKKK